MISSNREKVRKDLKISIDDFNTLTEELFHNPSSCIQKKKNSFRWVACKLFEFPNHFLDINLSLNSYISRWNASRITFYMYFFNTQKCYLSEIIIRNFLFGLRSFILVVIWLHAVRVIRNSSYCYPKSFVI